MNDQIVMRIFVFMPCPLKIYMLDMKEGIHW